MMQTRISNEIFVKDPSEELLGFCKENLVLDNPEYYVAEKMGRYLGNINQHLVLYEIRGDTLVIPFGTINNIWRYIKDSDFTLDFAPSKPLSMIGGIPLYPYQEKAVRMLVNAKNGILQAPCGSGKTQIGIALIKALGLKALWLTHTGDLLKQSKERAENYYKGDFGTITGGKVKIGKDITFATVQTMQKLDLQKYANEWNVIVVDECHRVAGTPTKVMQFYKVLTNLKARHKYGLSATIHRSDSLIKSTLAVLGDVVHTIKDKEVAEKIMKPSHIMIETGLPESEAYLDTDGTLHYNGLIDYLCESEERNQLIVDKIKSEPDRFHLVLSHRVQHLVDLQKLANVGKAISGSVTKNKRGEIYQEIRDGKLHVLFATFALAKEGLDIANLDRLHLVTPQKDKAIVKQSAGRIERRIEGKKDAIVYDYVDTNIGYLKKMFTKRKNILKKR